MKNVWHWKKERNIGTTYIVLAKNAVMNINFSDFMINSFRIYLVSFSSVPYLFRKREIAKYIDNIKFFIAKTNVTFNTYYLIS